MSERKPIRVAVSVPAGDQVKTGFAFDLANMIAATAITRDDVDIRLNFVRGTILPKSRETLVFMALEQDYTHVLFLDSDMRFPRNTLLQLLARDTYVVAANCTTRGEPVRPTAFANDENPEERVYTEPGMDGLQEVASIGCAVMLVDLDIFKGLTRPWFAMPFDDEARHFIGEDVYFCRKVKSELGLPILIDHALSQSIGHIGEWEYRHPHALALREQAAPASDEPEAPLIEA